MEMESTEPMPLRPRTRRGFLISIGLWLFFLVGTAYTSVATLFDRVASTEVMRAASGGAMTGKIALEVAVFLGVVLLIHLLFAVLNWVLALATAALSQTARAKFGRMVIAWFCVLAAGILAYNALWYPRTLIGAYYHDSVARQVAGIGLGRLVYMTVLVLALAVLAAASIRTWLRSEARSRRRTMWLGGFLLALGGVAVFWPEARSELSAAAPNDRPHVIILGIDSLRLEQLERFGGKGLTPNLNAFLSQADVFTDTTTPAARTFSSWTAILTGRSPVVTGARFNLAERSLVRSQPTLGDVLRRSGYRTVYSTDEVRFANIDETFGFDQVVTPRIGASDFLIGTYNELPLSALFINTRLGKFLFPFSYANRGVATMFLPETYVDRISRDVEFDRPTMFIAHLTAAHWPYYTGDMPFGISEPLHEHDRPRYRLGLQTADRMLGQLLDVLDRKGALKNAVIVVLSDHGEALGLPSDSFFDETFRVEGLRAPVKMMDTGHGQSVLSKSQYQVLLAFRSTGQAGALGKQGRSLSTPVTVEDIAPTLLELLGIGGNPLSTTGVSLAPILRAGDATNVDLESRIRFTETDLRVLPAPGGGVDEQATARQNSAFFEVDRKTARLHIRASYAPLALAYKERAAFTKDRLLAAIPAGPYAHQYIYIDFPARHGRLLLGRPGLDAPEAQRLWDALHEQYAGELHEAVATTREDWDRIGDEWDNFFRDRPLREAGADRTRARASTAPGTT